MKNIPIHTVANMLYLLSIVVFDTAVPEKEEVIDFSKVKVEPLFEEFVDFDTFSKSDFRAVKVKACEAVKKSKKLLQFTLDDGTGTDRTILSGIHAYYEPEELVGKTLIAIKHGFQTLIVIFTGLKVIKIVFLDRKSVV